MRKHPNRRSVVSSLVMLVVICASLPGSAKATPSWVVSDARAKPGETVEVQVSFRNDGSVNYALGNFFVDYELKLPAAGTLLSASPDALCIVESFREAFPACRPGRFLRSPR